MANIFRTASIWLKGAIIAFAIGLLLFVIGFATNAWMTRTYHYTGYTTYVGCGLWQRLDCQFRTGCVTINYSRGYINSYHEAIQAMECLGLIGFFLAFVLLLLYLIVDSLRRRDIILATTGVTFAGVLFASIGFALFGSSTNIDNMYGIHGNIGWSMGVAITGTILYGIGGILLIIQLIR